VRTHKFGSNEITPPGFSGTPPQHEETILQMATKKPMANVPEMSPPASPPPRRNPCISPAAKRRRGGNASVAPDKAYDLDQLEKRAIIHCTDEEIASFFGITVRTLHRRKQNPAFAAVLDNGRNKGKIALRASSVSEIASGVAFTLPCGRAKLPHKSQ
jgi:hypothetical protein